MYAEKDTLMNIPAEFDFIRFERIYNTTKTELNNAARLPTQVLQQSQSLITVYINNNGHCGCFHCVPVLFFL